MIGIHQSFYWYMTCFDTSSQLELYYHSACALQGHDGAPSLDVMMLKQQFFSGVLTALARDRAGAAMCMRSTPGCGTLAGPSLVLVDFRWSKPKKLADVPGLKRPGALGRPGRPGSVPLTRRCPAEVI